MRKCWTKKEDDILRKYYFSDGAKYCFNLLDRSIGSVYERVKKINLSKKIPKWTEGEISDLRKYYIDHGSEYCARLLNKPRRSIIKKAYRLKIKTNINKGWNSNEDDILFKYYVQHGADYCSNLLNKSKNNVCARANKLGLLSCITNGGFPKKQVIDKICNNKVMAICKKHGETPHYFRNGTIQHCIKCSSIKNVAYKKAERKTPLGLYKSRLRNSLNSAFTRISKINNTKKHRGCFRHLSYSPRQLCNHLEAIRGRQNNKCPMCQQSYDCVKISIDHTIPVKIANTTEEVLELFNLSNLSLLCLSCNSSKGASICP
jgi:hypothetical protein